MQKQEVANAWRDLDPQRRNFPVQPGKPSLVMGDGLADMAAVVQRRDPGRDGRAIGVERPASAIDGVAHIGRRITPAEPDPGKTVNLRESARHHDIFAGRDKLRAGRIIGAGHIFGIGRVEHKDDMSGQSVGEPLNLAKRQIRAGRIVWIGEEDHLGPWANLGEDAIGIGGQVLFRRDDWNPARRENGDLVDEKTMLRENAFVARTDVGGGEEVKDFVRARAADDSGRIETVPRAKRLAQGRGGAVRIILETIGKGTKTFSVSGRWPERRLVRRKLEYLGRARRSAFAWNIRVDVKNSWTRARPCLGPGHRDFCHKSKLRNKIIAPPGFGRRSNRSARRGCRFRRSVLRPRRREPGFRLNRPRISTPRAPTPGGKSRAPWVIVTS